jgi:hypothetical protein
MDNGYHLSYRMVCSIGKFVDETVPHRNTYTDPEHGTVLRMSYQHAMIMFVCCIFQSLFQVFSVRYPY